MIDGIVQQVAVMADDDEAARIAREVVFEPQGAFEVEIIGGLVKQEQVGLGEEHGSKRHAHAPAAGKLRDRPLLGVRGKPEAGEDRRGAGRGRMGVDVDEPHVDLGNAMRIAAGLGFRKQPAAFGIGGKHDVEQTLRSVRGFLRQPADPRPRRQLDAAGFRREVAGDGAEQGGFAGAIAPDQADAGTARKRNRGILDQKTAGDAQREIIYDEHGRFVRGCRRDASPRCKSTGLSRATARTLACRNMR